MKKIFFILFLTIATLLSCTHLDIEKGTPRCVKNKIKDFDKSSCETGANVKEYLFQNETVFVFDPGTCGADMTSEVIDDNCNTLGYLGGISGNTKINGEEFSNAVFQKVVWKK